MPLLTIVVTLLRRFELPQPWRRYPIQVALFDLYDIACDIAILRHIVLRAVAKPRFSLRLGSMKSPFRESPAT
jgi:hypothetical protein